MQRRRRAIWDLCELPHSTTSPDSTTSSSAALDGTHTAEPVHLLTLVPGIGLAQVGFLL